MTKFFSLGEKSVQDKIDQPKAEQPKNPLAPIKSELNQLTQSAWAATIIKHFPFWRKGKQNKFAQSKAAQQNNLLAIKNELMKLTQDAIIYSLVDTKYANDNRFIDYINTALNRQINEFAKLTTEQEQIIWVYTNVYKTLELRFDQRQERKRLETAPKALEKEYASLEKLESQLHVLKRYADSSDNEKFSKKHIAAPALS